MNDFQPTVTVSGPLNSTLFTTCCGVAIGEAANCPACHRLVLPLTLDARWAHVRHMAQIRAKGGPDAR